MEYMDAELYDYPSVGQIAQALREQDIIPIFAAERDARDFYDVRSFSSHRISIVSICRHWLLKLVKVHLQVFWSQIQAT